MHGAGQARALTKRQGPGATHRRLDRGRNIASTASSPAAARLDLPPSPTARIALPEGFAPRFAIFADAEEEFDWDGPFRRDATATTAIAALPEANARFVAAGCVPTHMVDWPVVANAASAATIRALLEAGTCEVGTQLHPWVTPPHTEPVSARNSYLGNLPRDLQRAKLHALTAKIEEALGVRPRCYRAGRYGIGEHTAALLEEAGYALDVSVRSGFDYRAQGGPNFARHPQWPYRVTERLAELPLTSVYIGRLRRWPTIAAAPLIGRVAARVRWLERLPLTPEGVPLGAALEAIDAALGDGHQLFSLSFHTPTLVPGHTPYVRDATDLRYFWRWWDGVFDRFAQRGVTGIRASEIMALLR